ncbi:MAG: winged helix-turn-helix transcriptional regulator [Granulosicoccus sp.]
MPELIGHDCHFKVSHGCQDNMCSKPSGSTKHSFDWRSNCPLSCALDVLGDKWSLLIIRDLLMHGTRTYSEFSESPENISTNILAVRLKYLTQLQLIRRVNPDGSSRGNAYELTSSGHSLEPVLRAYADWAHENLKNHNPHMVDV